MLTIRNEQMLAFSAALQRQFELGTLAHLRKRFPEPREDRTDEQLLTMIGQGISKAARYGIVSQLDVTRFIEYMVLYGPEFDSQVAWAREILHSPGIPAREKMDRIDDYDTFGMNRE